VAFLKTIGLIANHPLSKMNYLDAFRRYVNWQIACRLMPGEFVYQWIGGVKFIVRKGETGLVEAIYMGLLEFEDMAFFLHYIDNHDLFVDVGANVGMYTLLGCGVKGARGFAFEPVPETFGRLSNNIRLNQMEFRVRLLNAGVGQKQGSLYFTSGENVTNHVATEEPKTNSVKVNVVTLDHVLKNEKPTALKIDVEGYEIPVLMGARNVLKKSSLRVVLIETNGSGNRYGYSDDMILSTMTKNGFLPYEYNPLKRELVLAKNGMNLKGNTLFVRNLQDVLKKIQNAPQINVFGQKF
jgi:FkbM family methyltransferase